MHSDSGRPTAIFYTTFNSPTTVSQFTAHIAMSGELSTVDKTFQTGEVMEFKETDFRNLSDQNAQLVLKVLDAIAESYSSLININKLNRDLADNDELPF